MAAWVVALALFAAIIPAPAQTPGGRGVPSPPFAKLLKFTAGGSVQVAQGGATNMNPAWTLIAEGAELRVGDALWVGPNTRATVILHSDRTVVQCDAGSRLLLTPPPGRKSGFEAVFGRFYLFHRDRPEDFGVRKGRNWMIVRGTEVVLDVAEGDGPMWVNVLEGEVELDNSLGRTNVFSQETGVFEVGQPPRKTAMLPATSLVQWCLYYPAVIDLAELSMAEDASLALRASLDAYRQGHLPEALAAYPAGRRPATDAERIYLAAILLSAGQVAAAEQWIGSAAEPAEDAPRLAELRGALRMLIGVVRDPRSAATGRVGSGAATLASSLLAESYAEQARFRLSAALELARRSVERSPEFAFGWARVAELEFSFGRIQAAREAVEKSLRLASRNAQAIALNGFLLAARGRMTEATGEFERAIALDGALGNAWLGRGLSRIRRGDLAGGRGDLQTAAALEPNRAVLRSYLGKAFDAVGDTARAFREFDLARVWDANDPTAYLYSSLLHQQENRVNDAIRELERSQELNQNRRVYRSALLLDQDQAVRGANLATIYADAGLGDLALREAMRAVNLDYANASAHQFLSHSYAALNEIAQSDLRYETAQASEYLLAKLLAPVGAGPLSSFVSFQEYGRFFEQDGLHVASSTEYFSRGAWTQAGAQYGRLGDMAYSLDAFYRWDPGYRHNQDLELRQFSGQVKLQLTPQDSIYVQALQTRAEAGDLTRYYDPDFLNPRVRAVDRQEPLILAGYHREWSPGSHSLFLFSRWNDDFHVSNPLQGAAVFYRVATNDPVTRVDTFGSGGVHEYRSEFDLTSLEAQQILVRAGNTFVVGGRFQSGCFDTSSRSEIAGLTNEETFIDGAEIDNPAQRVGTALTRWSGYGYWQRQVVEPLRLIAGVGYDWIEAPANHRLAPISDRERTEERVSPKAGLIWTPHTQTTVRFGYSQALGGVSGDQSLQLEPSQIGGFNQAWRSLIPESAAGAGVMPRFETWGVAWDQKIGRNAYLGISGQWLRSDMTRERGVFDHYPAGDFVDQHVFQGATRERLEYDERSFAASWHQLAGRDWAFGVRYRLSHAELQTRYPEVPAGAVINGDIQARADERALLQQAVLFASYAHPSGFFGQAGAVWTWQESDGDTFARPGEDFWQFDAFIGYRFLRRHAEVRLGVLNLTDRDYRLNPLNLTSDLPRERTLFASFRFAF